MDSFYDAPRRAPLPAVSQRLLSAPVVPEISVLCPQNAPTVTNNYMSYGHWKMSQNLVNLRNSNKENTMQSPQNTSYMKKQVRFESPVLQQRPSLTYEPILSKTNMVLKENNDSNNCDFLNKNRDNMSGKKPQSFEQMYMANIPNRHLDLSVIETPLQKTQNLPQTEVNHAPVIKEQESKPPQTYKDFRKMYDEIKKVDNVTDILNYKPNKSANIDIEPVPSVTQFSESLDLHQFSPTIRPYSNQFREQTQSNNITKQEESKKSCQCNCASAVVPQTKANSDEPTVKDLLKIISQQNEQLLLLQKQVATLISRETNNPPTKQIEHAVQTSEKYVTSTQHEAQKNKFSIDCLTSFEVSYKRQTNMYQNKEFLVNHEPKIQEVTETESCSTRTVDKSEANRSVVDSSLFLQEPLDIRESCPSPEPSIKINMNDYEDSDEESNEDFSASEIGATFYKNLMGQVDKILRKAQMQNNEEFNCQNNAPVMSNKTSVKDQTMSKVKQATLKHLQSIGVNIDRFDDSCDSSSSSGDDKSYDASEVSFAVKQLLLKYLPDEHLAKIQQKPMVKSQMPAKCVKKDGKPTGIITNRPEFSFATVQYMKKYNLIASGKDGRDTNKRQQNDLPKILDISKLKQQPKLL